MMTTMMMTTWGDLGFGFFARLTRYRHTHTHTTDLTRLMSMRHLLTSNANPVLLRIHAATVSLAVCIGYGCHAVCN